MPAQILSGTTSASAFITASAAVFVCVARASAERGKDGLKSVPSFATTLIGRKIPSFWGMNSSKRASSRKIDRTIV